MDFIDLVKSRRTIRLFKQDRIAVETLIDLVDAARLRLRLRIYSAA